MTFSVEQLTAIKDLPDFLRTDHCYNDMQHAMLVILFRHGLTALQKHDLKYVDKLIDNTSLYLYIHFLNEEEGMVYKSLKGAISSDDLQSHSEMHVRFLDMWKANVLMPYRSGKAGSQQTLESLADFYNIIINHINHTDIPQYGGKSIDQHLTRNELARIARTGMPMSPFMSGAYDMVKILDAEVAASLNTSRLAPVALRPLGELDLVNGVGRILEGQKGSLRDRFARATRGEKGGREVLHERAA